MNEISYSAAIEAGLDPLTYRTDALEALGAGSHPGTLDALVWSKRAPCLMALVTLDVGVRVLVLGYQQHSRRDLPPYLGLRELSPGQPIELSIDVGIRGGLRPLVRAMPTVEGTR